MPTQHELKFAGLGRAARQKRVRRQIRSSPWPTAVHITAWAECYQHWKALNEGINKPNKDNGNGERENNLLSSSSDVRQSADLFNRCSFQDNRTIGLSGRIHYFSLHPLVDPVSLTVHPLLIHSRDGAHPNSCRRSSRRQSRPRIWLSGLSVL